MVVTTAAAAILTGVLMCYYKYENKRRDRVYADHVHQENSEFFDLTDRENPEFRVSVFLSRSDCKITRFQGHARAEDG